MNKSDLMVMESSDQVGPLASSNVAVLERRPWLRHYDAGVPEQQAPSTLTLPDLLARSAERFPDNVALAYQDETLTYRELAELVDRWANALLSLGLNKGDRVAVVLPNSPEFVIAYYGTVRMGSVVTPTNPTYVARELQHQLADNGARAIVIPFGLLPTVESIWSDTALEHVIVVGAPDEAEAEPRSHKSGSTRPVRFHHFWKLVRGASTARVDVELVPSDLALLLYTGGTTGTPKGAMLTHANVVANAHQTCRWLATTREGEEVVLAALPLFHVYGMTVAMNYAIGMASSLVLAPRFDAREVLRLISRHKVTVFPGVPTMYIAISSCPETPAHDIRSIKACICGAAPLPTEVQARFEAITGGRLMEGFGLTEAAPVTHLNPMLGQRKVGSIGLPLPGTDARIVDLIDGERELPPGEAGELLIRGPQVMAGYWEKPEENERTLRDGWLYTGDIARQDVEGYFYIVDRKKDIIFVGGFSVYPREIEEVLYQHPKVREAVAVGVPDARLGEVVRAYVTLRAGEEASAKELIRHCRKHLARHKSPVSIELRDALPRSAAGKLLRRVLAAEARQRK